MSDIGRNAACPCGSGLKYKRCCLRREDELVRDTAETERVWDRMQSWALRRFKDDFDNALKEHMEARGVGTEEHPANDDDLALALTWLLIDRPVAAGGRTPARQYADLPAITEADRDIALRIAGSQLGLYRVADAERGAAIDLENVLSGGAIRVTSPTVSRAAARWHVLLCRVMEGGPMASLWGGVRLYEPSEEVELVAEIRRVADAHGLGTDEASLERALHLAAGELVHFEPPSRRAERVPYTLEGDLVALAEASWELRAPNDAFQALSSAPELSLADETVDGAEVTFEWLTSRRGLLARRPPLPAGAVCVETGPAFVDEDGELEVADVTSLGTFTLCGERLEYSGISEARLVAAIALAARRLGGTARLSSRRLRSVDQALSAVDSAENGAYPMSGGWPDAMPEEDEPSVPDAHIRGLLYRRWIDDPNERLGGLSPRAAAARGEHRDELERQLRSLEHQSACERADGRPGTEVSWLRDELAPGGGLLAA